jgi:hypothetical protein
MTERREKSGEVDSLRTATSAQIIQVIAARKALGLLREGIWAEPAEMSAH